LVVCGVLAGFVIAWGFTRAMTKLLLGVTNSDPSTYAIAALTLVAVALLACYVPARRAMRVAPMVALRYE